MKNDVRNISKLCLKGTIKTNKYTHIKWEYPHESQAQKERNRISMFRLSLGTSAGGFRLWVSLRVGIFLVEDYHMDILRRYQEHILESTLLRLLILYLDGKFSGLVSIPIIQSKMLQHKDLQNKDSRGIVFHHLKTSLPNR